MDLQKSEDKAKPLVWSERFRLASLKSSELWTIFGAAVVVTVLFAMFHFMGNTAATVHSRSAFLWMWSRWQDVISFGGVNPDSPEGSGADYSHGILIPFVSLWALWHRRHELMSATREMDWRGLIFIVLALTMHWIGAKMQQTRVSLMALILLLWALPFFFWGWKTAKHLLFPVGYLIFCIPLNFLDIIAFPLRILAAKISVGSLHAVGVDVIRDGSKLVAMDLLGHEKWAVDVAAPCSGLRSLLAMTALTAVYAWVTQDRQWKKWMLLCASIPLAIAGNVARIATIGLVAETFGQKLATGAVHDFSGYVVFAVGIVLMLGIGALLKMDVRSHWRQWRQRIVSPTGAA